ncbi:hypothetical protein QYM36_000644 [Artemia franciscana]|uniref:Uncharacterized protein n=1 Tax=Artemia franciscana TaxID=6661 RepID=A0AA88LL88_ARTSF|nr:hypothetical protein QYM36_000644 [Artemia franciscana]
MTDKVGCEWQCTLCKVRDSDRSASSSSVEKVIDNSLCKLRKDLKVDLRVVSRNLQQCEGDSVSAILKMQYPRSDDETGAITHIICSSYDFDPGPITTVRRLNASTSRPSTMSWPALLIFLVSLWDIKKKILQISRQ